MKRRTRSPIHGLARALVLLVPLTVALALATPAWAAATTKRVSVRSNEAQANAASTEPVISGNGRFVVFQSDATNLVVGDTNDAGDVFVRDRKLGTTRRVSVRSNEAQGNSSSQHAAISASGRFVVFDSSASNLVSGDGNNQIDIFVRDLQLGTTRLLSVRLNGTQGNGASYDPSISGDGRFVVFTSEASNLIGNDTNGSRDVFIRDRQQNTTKRVSVSSAEVQGNGDSQDTVISADGGSVVFLSGASNLVGGDTNAATDVFVRDRAAGTTRRVSVSSAEAEANGDSDFPVISAAGRFVAFMSVATDLISGDTNLTDDIFVRDRTLGTTRRVSVSSAEEEGENGSYLPSISANGRFVVFAADASNLIGSDGNGVQDVFIRDRNLGTTRRISVSSAGGEGDGRSHEPAISADGRFIAFESSATTLVAVDTNAVEDIFVRGPLF